ncbi:MAG: ATP-dependent metallopeptidase FtsH/Yme1/Tma family protein [Clostridiales bacterium]|jgi:cell division protease FtsH|nr:ATP-dependent metallopeptidase FtsH/Yme1/Tma family protein [Clostridiales bacterium]
MFNKNNIIKYSIIFWIIIVLAYITIFNRDEPETYTYNQFLEQIRNNNVEKVVLSESSKLTFKLKGKDTMVFTDNPRKESLKEELLKNNIAVEESTFSSSSAIQTALSLIFIGAMFFYFNKITNKGHEKSTMAVVNQSPHADGALVRFTDIAGNDEAKDSVSDIIDFIKFPEKYSKYGAKMPKGLIFYGPPGTGKTLMAKAIAGEAGVPFYAVSGSDFVQMYVGVGASRIRDLFKKARESEKAVIFIDEIDAIGKKRALGNSGANDERDQTLNALLTEMSGFSSSNGIIVIAATNRIDTLDEALLRPGRFDRHIEIGLPDFNARKTILSYYFKEKPIAPTVDILNIAKQTVYFSGAMLENLVNEASIFAAKAESEAIHTEHFDQAYYTIVAGSEKKDRSNIKEKDRQITAYHEAGHALVTKILLPENSVSKVTIIPSTKGIGGFSLNIPPDKMYYTKKELEAQIMVSFAGRAAEELIFGPDSITTGASNDIEKATSIVKDYITKYGMSQKTGLINTALFSSDTDIMQECAEILDMLYKESFALIKEKSHVLDKIANTLLRKESLEEEELDAIIISGNKITA